MKISFPSIAAIGIVAIAAAVLAACAEQSALHRIDWEVDALLVEMNQEASVESSAPQPSTWRFSDDPPMPEPPRTDSIYEEDPSTVNPTAAELEFMPNPEAENDFEAVVQRLRDSTQVGEDARHLALTDALAYAQQHSREYRFAEEDYVISALRLLVERHRWGPRFFNDTSASIQGSGDDGLFDTSLRLVNDLSVTQRLPYGGVVSARALATATEDLHRRVAGERVNSVDVIFGADIPLLRGAGMSAREDRIQAERNLVYAARDFERFRREFLVAITRDFLDLVVLLRNTQNAQRSVASFEKLQSRERALFEAGRRTRFDFARAEQDTVESLERLTRSWESFKLALDRFKVRLGMSPEEPVVIDESSLNLPVPEPDNEYAVRVAMNYRLDLQTQRDRRADSKRAVLVARNDLLPDLDLSGSVSIPTDPERGRSGLRFEPGYSDWDVGVTFGLPLDREIERLNLRQTQIALERTEREYNRFRDDVAVNVRRAVREIDRALFSLEIQERNIEIAQQRLDSINADPDRATVQDQSDAINGFLTAKDNRASAERDLELAILGYLLSTGQLRVEEDGSVRALRGMEFQERLLDQGIAPPVNDP